MKYRLVIFDFDGTLADSFPWVVGLLDQLTEKYNLPRMEPGDFEQLRGYDLRQIFKQVGAPPWKLPRMGRDVLRRMTEQIDQIPLFAGADRLLQTLAEKGATLAVVSSNSRANVCQVLGPANTARICYFECGVSLFGKAAKLRKVLRQSGARPSEAIMIGDEIRDLEAAQAVHMAAGAVTWGYNHLAALQARAPDEVFARMEAIAEKLT